ncbi:MAG TPA: F0F1 ATP synthase subunit epsilon [Ruania sp.]|nr:F0F1 ATP synthase subunit epsilon [Ruania sp.]
MPLNVEMVSADRTVWSGEALSVAAPAAEGDMGVLPGHQPVLTVLRPGAVRVRPLDGEALQLEVSGGFLSVDHDEITIVVDPTTTAEAAADTQES